MDSNLSKEQDNNCGNSARKWLSIGIAPTGIISIGIVPMGVISIGIVPMGVISIGTVAMGTIAAGFVSMGLFSFGSVGMGLNNGHFSNLNSSPTQSPQEHHHH
jgi:hypothetical protein